MSLVSRTETAVVIGASMAGLLAARALADTFRQVIIVERDGLPVFQEGRYSPRKGVPQGIQPHLLLVRGHQSIEALFPGFTEEMLTYGAEQIDVGESIRWYQEGAFFQRRPVGNRLLLASRLLIEAVVRLKVERLPNVHIIAGAAVQSLLHDPDCRRVTGVCIERRSSTAAPGEGPIEGRIEDLAADLVVDAGGRGSRAPAWLEALGFPRPEEERVEIKVSYAARYYERRREDLDGDAGVIITPSAERNSFALLIAQEGTDEVPLRWQLTLGGYFGHAPGPSDAEYLEYARSLPDATIYTALKDRPPLTPVIVHKFPASRRLHYEKLERFPDGLLVFGDAIASFNPAYGQGMTISALEALALQACLRAGADELAPRFFKEAAGLIDIAWATAVGADLQFPQTAGKRTLLTRFSSWYMARLVLAARRDHELRTAFLNVTNLLQPPQSLLAPRLALKVFFH